MTWRELIDRGTSELQSRGIEEARLNAELLALHVMRLWNRADLKDHLGTEVSQVSSASFQSFIRRRASHEPLQYIIGETEFYGIRLWVNPSVLIPRPETELLVEETLRELREEDANLERVRILDIGTGSGAIAIAVGVHAPNAQILGIDASPESIALAAANTGRAGVSTRVEMRRADIFDKHFIELHQRKFDVIVSNPPYIPMNEYLELEPELREYEPRIALTDEGDGLSYYRRIGAVASSLLKPDGMLLLEIGFNARNVVEAILEANNLMIIRVVKDLSGIDRVIVGKTNFQV